MMSPGKYMGSSRRPRSMSYYEIPVLEYLRRDRGLFANPEYCIQIEPGKVLEKGSY
jgi:hypothetical protein